MKLHELVHDLTQFGIDHDHNRDMEVWIQSSPGTIEDIQRITYDIRGDYPGITIVPGQYPTPYPNRKAGEP